MDWTPTDMQAAIQELAGTILKDAKDPWAALVEAELTEVDDIVDVCALLTEVGKVGGPSPALATLALGWPIRALGSAPAGAILTGGLLEDHSRDPRAATTVAHDGKLTGRKICVPAVDVASHMAVVAQDGVYAVALADCVITPQASTNGDSLGVVELRDTPAERLGGLDVLDDWLVRVHLGVAALQLGLCETALQMTAAYVGERKQFGRPIGTFQAVSQRAADAWIDIQAMELTLLQASWRVSQGLPADREVLIARYVASEHSHRVVAAAQHLHGGFGFDRDYPLHRYFLTSKLWEFLLGGAESRLEELGDLVASGAA